MRVENWDQRLVQTVELHRETAFSWGRSDCATLFADCVEAVTGVDPLADLRGWKDERGALRALVSTGHDSVAAWIASNFDEIVPATARRGDCGYTEDALTLGFPAIVCGSFAVSRDEDRWVHIPLTALVRCFKVG